MSQIAKKRRRYRYSAANPKPPIYVRRCNRCGREYRGLGRLLCAFCFQYASQSSPYAEGWFEA